MHFKMEPVGRKVRSGIRVELRPSLVCGPGKPAVQEKKELIRAAVNGGWLPEGEPGPDCALQSHALGGHMLVQKKFHEA
jgi:hypothetical protein